MASWKKYLRSNVAPVSSGVATTAGAEQMSQGTSAKFASYLPEVYAGHPNRIQRYSQYEEMNRDSFVRAALDTLAEFCTQSEEATDNPFEVIYLEEGDESIIKILKVMLDKWISLNEFPTKMFSIFRNTIMNGDSFFLRDPETSEWTFLDHYSVIMAKVDEQNGRKIEDYLVKGFDDFRRAKYSSQVADLSQYRGANGQNPMVNSGTSPGGGGSGSFQMAGFDRDPRAQRQRLNSEFSTIDAKHIIHLSMSDGLDINWPFGPSILESVFKVWKQKELLEDAIIIYRVSRAPERRVFYIDVGMQNAVQAQAHIERIKNEIHQRRIPNRVGGGASMMDAAHNPLSMLDDYFFAQTSEGRGSKVEVLPGGDSVGEITDLSYFKNELALGFRIPKTYLPYGDDAAGAAYNDGKLGTATIQEFMFNKTCMRMQSLLAPVFDADFKRFLTENGVEVEGSMFRLKFCPPQNFTKYRQIELDSQQVGVYGQVASMPDISKRFAKKKYLGWTEEDIIENETSWAQENPKKIKAAKGGTMGETESEGDLSSVGVQPMGGDPFGGDPAMDAPAEGDPAAGGDPSADAGATSPIGSIAPGGAPAAAPPAPGGAPA